MKLLIIDDEPKTASFLKKGLEENGFSVDAINNGTVGFYQARQGVYDLIILDVMLPGQDGWSIVKALRQSRVETPVLFLTARDGVPDRVRGLELGADDYITKPFAFSELLARIRAILRRGPTRQIATLQVADLEIDVQRHKVTRNGKLLDLTPKEFLLVALLARRAGDVMSRSLIAEQVWGVNFDSDTNVLDVHMRRLRAKLDDPFELKLVHTVRGIGYVLEDRTAR